MNILGFIYIGVNISGQEGLPEWQWPIHFESESRFPRGDRRGNGNHGRRLVEFDQVSTSWGSDHFPSSAEPKLQSHFCVQPAKQTVDGRNPAPPKTSWKDWQQTKLSTMFQLWWVLGPSKSGS